LSRQSRALAYRLAEGVHYVELMVKRSFTDVFAQSLGVGHGNQPETPMTRTN
jgi:methylmalonyl-CoA mutase N-terminal domain/subunit